MRVRAIEMGFWGGARRRPGAVFEVPDGTQAKWFVPVAQPDPEPKPKKRERNTLKDLGDELTHASDKLVRE